MWVFNREETREISFWDEYYFEIKPCTEYEDVL